MTSPNVSITKSDGNTGVVRPSATGILAIIATAASGPTNVAAGYARPDLVDDDYGALSDLTDDAAYVMSVAKKPVLLVRAAASTAGDYGTVTTTGGGTSVVTAGVTDPLADLLVRVKFVAGGTIGVAGITYKYSLDDGETYSSLKALGTATAIVIPNTGVTLQLAAGTILADEEVSVPVTGPKMTNADLVDALEALRVVNASWEAVYVDAEADATMLTTVDTWLSTLEGTGKFRLGILNGRRKADGESEVTFKGAMQTAWASSSTIRALVCADGADRTTTVAGVTFLRWRPTALRVAARLMAIDPSTDAAYVSDGPLPDTQITDERQNPKWHDEALYPGLDDLRMTSLRSFEGRAGAYVNDPLLMSPAGSDYVYAQHARLMNLACERAYQLLTQRLSIGVRKNRVADQTTGQIYILEEDAADVEAYVDSGVKSVLANRVSDAAFVLSRTDDLSSNAGATLSGEIQIQSRSYVKRFDIVAKFVRQITATAA